MWDKVLQGKPLQRSRRPSSSRGLQEALKSWVTCSHHSSGSYPAGLLTDGGSPSRAVMQFCSNQLRSSSIPQIKHLHIILSQASCRYLFHFLGYPRLTAIDDEEKTGCDISPTSKIRKYKYTIWAHERWPWPSVTCASKYLLMSPEEMLYVQKVLHSV